MLLTHRGCMSVIARSPDGTIRLFCKGSDAKVTAVLLLCWLKAEQALIECWPASVVSTWLYVVDARCLHPHCHTQPAPFVPLNYLLR